MAKVFAVSKQAVAIRLGTVGVVTFPDAAYL